MIDIMIRIIQMNIITNIAAGLVLFIVLKKFIDWQDERRQFQNAQKADKSIYALLRPYIAAETFPSPEIFQSFATTVAREHDADPADLCSVKYYCQEFIRDIMENDYIPQEQKTALIDLLKEQIHSYEKTPAPGPPRATKIRLKKNAVTTVLIIISIFPSF